MLVHPEIAKIIGVDNINPLSLCDVSKEYGSCYFCKEYFYSNSTGQYKALYCNNINCLHKMEIRNHKKWRANPLYIADTFYIIMFRYHKYEIEVVFSTNTTVSILDLNSNSSRPNISQEMGGEISFEEIQEKIKLWLTFQ